MKKIISILVVVFILLQYSMPVYWVNTNSQATPWTREKAEQLARKALFSANPDIVTSLYNAWSASNAVDILFPSIEWPDRSQFNQDMSSFLTQTWFSMSNSSWMHKYYVYKKYKDPYEAKAKAFVMFEDIFSANVDNSNIYYSDLYNTHNLIENNMFWSYKSLVKKITYNWLNNWWDYTMWTFLNLFNQQYPSSPNENYARELLQLFLMLEYKPWENQDNSWAVRNYTSVDVASLAKILTWLESNSWTHLVTYNPQKHYSWSVVFLSWSLKQWDSFAFYNSASWTINTNLIANPIWWNNWVSDNVIDYIFSKRWNEIADFLAWRLLKYYVKDKPTQSEIESLASYIYTNDFDMYSSIKYLLKSDIMYSDEAMNTVYYKNPLELTIWTLKLLHYKNPQTTDPFLSDTSLLTSFEWTPYYPWSIFGRDWFDSNAKFFNSYNHNQWVNYSTKLAYYYWSWYYNLQDLIPTTRVSETWSSMYFATSTGNTFTGSISLSNMSLNLSWNFWNSFQIFNSAPSEEVSVDDIEADNEIATWSENTENINKTQSWSELDGSWELNSQTGLINEIKAETTEWISNQAISFSWIQVSLPTFSITASNNTTILIWPWRLDMQSKKIYIYSWSLTQSWTTYLINSWSADISQDSQLNRDINPDELITQLEDYLYLWRRLPQDVKTQIISFALTWDNWSSRLFLPNDTNYRNTVIRWIISIMLVQPEFVMNMWYDKQTNTSNSNSLLPSSNSKLVLIEQYWWYDWLNAIIKKSDYNDYITKRWPIAIWTNDLIDLWDYYLNSSFSSFKQYYDSNNLRIVNRVWTPKHSRWHDTAAIQVTSERWLETAWTPSIIGKLIENESDATKSVVLWNNSPNIYSNWNYLNIWWNSSIYTNYWNWLTASWKTAQLNTIKSILNSRSYPWTSSNLFKWSVTIDTVANTSKNSWWQPSSWYNLRQRLDFTKILIDNNLWTTYYVPWGGWYDTHSDELTPLTSDYDLNNRVADLSNEVSRFFESVRNKDVTIVIYSEFWRTLKANWTNWTDHGQWGWYFILSSNSSLLNNLPNKIIWNMNLSKEKNDWFWVWVDYRAIYNKILTSLYGISDSYLWTTYNLDDYIDNKLPNPAILREEYRPNGNNNLYLDIKFNIEDKNFILNEASNIEFYYWTNSWNLTRYSDWSIQNYALQQDWSYKLWSISVPKNTQYYYKLIIRDDQFNEYEILKSIRTPDNLNNATTTISRNWDSVLQRYNNTNVSWTSSLATPITIFNNSWTWALQSISWQDWITIEQNSSSWVTINSLFASSWSMTWNWWFLLPREVNTGSFISNNSFFSWTQLSSLNIKKIIKLWSDINWVWMNLSNPIKINIFYSWTIDWRLRIITSEDWINWNDISSWTWVFNSWIISFLTDRLSYFAIVDEATDTAPNAYNFVDQTNLELNTPIESNSITISWIDWPTTIFVNTWEYLVNTWNYTTLTWTVRNWDTIKLRLTSATSNNIAKSMIVNIWWVTDTWNITTKSVTWVWGWGGGWWWSSFSRDNCPNWDYSASYYDWTCWTVISKTLTWTLTNSGVEVKPIVLSNWNSVYSKIKTTLNKINWINKKISFIEKYIAKLQALIKSWVNSNNVIIYNELINKLVLQKQELQKLSINNVQTKNVSSSEITQVIETKITTSTWYINTTVSYVVAREDASLRSKITEQISNWEPVEIIAIYQSWWVKIKHNWIISYLRKTYIKF